MTSLGERVREARDLMDISREKLAELLDISPQHLAKIEQGERKISIELLQKMSHQFCVSTDYILLGKKALKNQTLTIDDMLTELTEAEREIVEQMIKLTIRALRKSK